MGELWVKVKPWAVGIACGWILLAFVFLMASVDHPLFSTETATKIYKTVSDIVLLKWVTKYQTLLAGLSALAGGLGIIIATKIQILHQKRTNEQELVSEAAALLNTIANCMQDTYQQLKKAKTPLDISELFKPYFFRLSRIDSTLSFLLMRNINEVEALKNTDITDASREAVFCYATSIVFREHSFIIKREGVYENYFSIGTKLNGRDVEAIAKQHHVKLSQIEMIRLFFNFEPEPRPKF